MFAAESRGVTFKETNMTNARAARPFRLAGKSYAQGDPVTLGDQQFRDLEAAGLVTRVARPPARVAAKVSARTKRATKIADPGNEPPAGTNHGAE